MDELRCKVCQKKLAVGIYQHLEIKCGRCKTIAIFMRTASSPPERHERSTTDSHANVKDTQHNAS